MENTEKMECEKRYQDFRRDKYILAYFNENQDRMNTRNVNYLQDFNAFLKKDFPGLSEKLTILLSKTLDGKADVILKKKDALTLRGKLQSFEASREEKKSLVDQWIGELI
ncbi:MAG: hypothetical protein AABY32_07195 [Nanoarchaeota archaeon]